MAKGKESHGDVYAAPDVPYNYIVIIDAGSTGSRVHVYHYPGVSDNEHHVQDGEKRRLPQVSKSGHKWRKKVRPGLASFADDYDDLEDYLEELIDYAESIVPKSQRKRTPIFLYATGGVRALPNAKRHKLLQETCKQLKEESHFYLPDCDQYVMAIDGETEGIFGWLALNYLIGGLDDPTTHDHGKGHSTYGFLDMGGASTQITFAPNTTETDKHKQKLYRVALGSLSGDDDAFYDVYSRTYDGLGVHLARKNYFESLSEGHDGEVEDPCLPHKLTVEEDGENGIDTLPEIGGDSSHVTKLIGTGEFDVCAERIQPLVKDIQEAEKPAFDFEVNHFVGVSEYWDTLGDDGFQMGGSFDYAELSAKVREFCSREWDDIEQSRKTEFPNISDEDLELLCFKSTYLLEVVSRGLGFPTDASPVNSTKHLSEFMQPLSAAEEINGVEFSWTLGRALLFSSAELTQSSKHVGIQMNEASSAWNFGATTYKRPKFVASKDGGDDDDDGDWDDWDDMFDKHSHRLWGSLLFLLILAVACYLLLGKARRGYIYQSIRSRFGRKGGYTNLGRRNESDIETGVDDFELGQIDEEIDDAYELDDDDGRRRP